MEWIINILAIFGGGCLIATLIAMLKSGKQDDINKEPMRPLTDINEDYEEFWQYKLKDIYKIMLSFDSTVDFKRGEYVTELTRNHPYSSDYNTNEFYMQVSFMLYANKGSNELYKFEFPIRISVNLDQIEELENRLDKLFQDKNIKLKQ